MSEQALNVYDYAEEKGAAFRVAMRGVEWMSRCIVPGCSSQQDAFSVQPEGKCTGRWAGYGAWMCRKCWNPDEMVTWKDGTRRKKGWGNIADLVMACEGISYRDAEAFILAREGGSPAHHIVAPRYATQTQMTDDAWYAKYVPYLNTAFQNEKQIVSTYCASRGLTDETITFLKFGFSLDPVKMKDDTFRTIPFLVIPWHKDDGTLYRKVNRRNLHIPLPTDEDKYRLVAGSQKEDLYLGYTLKQQKRPTFLVESEICAATILQEAGDLVNVVATGSVTHGKNAVNEGRLRRQPFVFVAFDADTEGEEASFYWLSKLDNPAKHLRYRPLVHDVSEMHTTGLSVRKWVENALQLVAASPGVDQQSVESQPSPAGDPPVSSVQDAPPVDPGQVDDPIHPAIRAAMCLCQQGIIFRLEDDCLVVYYRPAVAEEVDRLHEHRGVLTDWVRSIRQKETGYAEATAFYEQFCAQPGYGLRLREDNKVGVTVPESVSDADFKGIVDAVCAQGDGLKQVLKQRTEEKRKQEPAATCCRCALPVEHYSPGGHAYCTACYRCARCNQMPRWVYNPERDLQVCACVMEASQRVTRYTPYTLSAFSRTKCPHHVITLKDNRFRSTSCKGKTLEHGWCADHAYAHELLCLGAALGYPAVHGDYRHIEQRVENWEVYAACTSTQHAAGDVARIRTRYRYHAPLDLSVPVVQKTTQPTQWAQSSVYTSVLATRSKLDPMTSMEVSA